MSDIPSSGFVSPETIARDEASEDGVVFYGVGICHTSACAPAGTPIDTILDAVNRRWPTGLDWGWGIDTAPTFADGLPNPCPCEQDPSRVHRLLSC